MSAAVLVLLLRLLLPSDGSVSPPDLNRESEICQMERPKEWPKICRRYARKNVKRYMPENMLKDMPERIPEDMPEIECQNATVGATSIQQEQAVSPPSGQLLSRLLPHGGCLCG